MTQNEFLTRLDAALKKNGVTDAREILGEYEEHFAFKRADGYGEEEIAARLGDPEALAAQFDAAPAGERRGGNKLLAVIALVFADFFAGAAFLLLWAWELVMAAAALCFAALGVCLLAGANYRGLIPAMPYWCGAVFGVSLLALGCLSAAGCVWFAAYLRQLMRAFARFAHNALAAADGAPVLPPLPCEPRLAPKTRRVLRRAALLALTAFAVSFVLGLIVSMLSAGALQFWHAWGWFGYPGA